MASKSDIELARKMNLAREMDQKVLENDGVPSEIFDAFPKVTPEWVAKMRTWISTPLTEEEKEKIKKRWGRRD